MSASIEQVYMEYKGLLFSLAYRMTGSAAEAEDIVQETFAALAGADLNEIRHVKSYWCTLRPIFSGRRVASFWLGIWPRWANHSAMEIRSINGQDGIAVFSQGELKIIVQISLNQQEDRIERMYLIVNPDKLAHLQKINGGNRSQTGEVARL